MLNKSQIEQLQSAMQRELQARKSDVVKCAAGILLVFGLSVFGPIIGVEAGARASDIVTFLDQQHVLEHLVGIAN